jgi:hypothetical protein
MHCYQESYRFAIAEASPLIRVPKSPLVITSIEFEPDLPAGTTAMIVLDEDPPVPVHDMLSVARWTEATSSCGRLIAAACPAKFIDQSRFEIVNLKFVGHVPTGTSAIVQGISVLAPATGGLGVTAY